MLHEKKGKELEKALHAIAPWEMNTKKDQKVSCSFSVKCLLKLIFYPIMDGKQFSNNNLISCGESRWVLLYHQQSPGTYLLSIPGENLLPFCLNKIPWELTGAVKKCRDLCGELNVQFCWQFSPSDWDTFFFFIIIIFSSSNKREVVGENQRYLYPCLKL